MRWYLQVSGQTSGPVDDATVTAWQREGRLGPGTLIAAEGSNQWAPIDQSPFASHAAGRKSGGTSKTLLIIGGVVLLGFGSCVVCVGVAGKGKGAKAAASAAPAKPEAPFVAAIVQLAANPKAGKPKVGKPDKKDKDAEYEYANPVGIPAKVLSLSVSKANAQAWEIVITEADAPTMRVTDFAPSDGLSKLPTPALEGFEQYEITKGSLKGSVLEHLAGGTFAVMTLPYALEDGLRWACENHAPETAMTWSTFEDQCRNMVRAKLLVPNSADFPGLLDGTDEERHGVATANCGWRWAAWVESTNAFNVKIRHPFTCTNDPKAQTVSLAFE